MSALDWGSGTGTIDTGHFTVLFPTLPDSDWCLGVWVRLGHLPPVGESPHIMCPSLDIETAGDANQGIHMFNTEYAQFGMGYHALGGSANNVYSPGPNTLTYSGQDYFMCLQRRSGMVQWYYGVKGTDHSAGPQEEHAMVGTTIASATQRIGDGPYSGDSYQDPLGELFLYDNLSLTPAQITAIAAGARPPTQPLILLPFRSGYVATEPNLGSGGSTYDATAVGGNTYTTTTDFFPLPAAVKAGNQYRQRRI